MFGIDLCSSQNFLQANIIDNLLDIYIENILLYFVIVALSSAPVHGRVCPNVSCKFFGP